MKTGGDPTIGEDDFRLELPYLPSTPRLAATFIFGLVFNYAQDSARSWAAPYRLEKRLGSLALPILAEGQQSIVASIAMAPALHRFPNAVGTNIAASAALILSEFKGDARRIWNRPCSVEELKKRFERLPGIGPHKALIGCYLLVAFRLVPFDQDLAEMVKFSCPKLYEATYRLLDEVT